MIGHGISNGDALTEERPRVEAGVSSPTITIPDGRWGRALQGGRALQWYLARQLGRVVQPLNLVQKFNNYKTRNESSRSETVDRLLRLGVMIGLFVAAGAAFLSASLTLVGRTSWEWLGAIVPAWLNAALLIFIILELAHTVREQIEERYLSGRLVCHLLAIGVLSSVRHLLAVGAKLTINQGPTIGQGQGNLSADTVRRIVLESAVRRGEILELSVSAAMVLLLVIGWRLAGGSLERKTSVEPSLLTSQRGPSTSLAHSTSG